MKRSLLTIVAAAGPVLGVAGGVWAQQSLLPGAIQPGTLRIELKPVASGLASPVTAVAAPGNPNDLFVVDQIGKVNVVRNGVMMPTPFLDITSIQNQIPLRANYDERGLLGLAFSPGFSNPASPGYRKFYTYHSEKAGTAAADFAPAPGTVTGAIDHQNVVTEWQVSAADPSVVDLSSRRDLIREDHPSFNHNGGTLAFGLDGHLYWGLGDGGNANDSGTGHIPSTGNAQDPSVITGKMLRIDPYGNNSANGRYGIPADNPFVGTPGAHAEIYATGFRNPYRFSVDTPTGRLVVADVGQGNVEEVDLVTKGGNYGWAVKEGTFLFDRATGTVNPVSSPGLPAGLIDPVLQYDHTDGIAIVGGFVYHGTMIPELQGKYVFGDFSDSPFSGPANGRLFYADLDTGEIREFLIGNPALPLGLWLKGFGQDPNGELYVLASTRLGPSGTNGVVLQITPEPTTLALVTLASVAALRRRRRTR